MKLYEEINTEEDSPATYSYINAPSGLSIMENHYYCFGQLWDGDGGDSNGKELLDSGSITMWNADNEPVVVKFDNLESDSTDLLDTMVHVTDIF